MEIPFWKESDFVHFVQSGCLVDYLDGGSDYHWRHGLFLSTPIFGHCVCCAEFDETIWSAAAALVDVHRLAYVAVGARVAFDLFHC